MQTSINQFPCVNWLMWVAAPREYKDIPIVAALKSAGKQQQVTFKQAIVSSSYQPLSGHFAYNTYGPLLDLSSHLAAE